jgi:hypothetical protein
MINLDNASLYNVVEKVVIIDILGMQILELFKYDLPRSVVGFFYVLCDMLQEHFRVVLIMECTAI